MRDSYVWGRLEKIVEWAKTRRTDFNADAVMEAHDVRRRNAQKALSRLVMDGRLVRVSPGLYRVAP